MERFPITPNGLERIKEEVKRLKTVDRPAVTQAIAEARALGDLSENAEYSAAREKQSFIEGRIMELEDKMARAEVIDVTKLKGTSVKFGATIKLLDDETEEEVVYQIVSEYEADLNAGRISINSPIAKALIGKEKSDMVEVKTPKGSRSFEIIDVMFI